MKETKKNWLNYWFYWFMPGSMLGRETAIKLSIVTGLVFIILILVAECNGQRLGAGSGGQVRFTIEIDKK